MACYAQIIYHCSAVSKAMQFMQINTTSCKVLQYRVVFLMYYQCIPED